MVQMSKAYHAVIDKKMSVYKASREYGIPESTLRDRFLTGVQFNENKLPNFGGGRLLNDEEERVLVEHLNHMDYLGYGYTKKDILLIATDYAISLNKYPKSLCLGKNWFKKFKRRFPDVNPKKQQTLAMERENATSAGTVHIYYTNLKAMLDSGDISGEPSSIYILDEVVLPMEQNAEDVYVKHAPSDTGESDSGEKSFTLIGCANATGSLVPPYIVLPGKKWSDSYLEGTCPGSDGECSQDGDTNTLVFSNYFNKHFRKFVPFGKDSKPIVVLYDGQKLNLVLTLKTFGEENNIMFFVLPPHVSSVVELNLDCFHPLIEVFSKESCLYLRKKNELSLENIEVGRLASKAYLKTMTPAALSAAFKRIGVYPFDSSVVRQSEIDDRALDFTGFFNQSDIVGNSEDDLN